MKNDTIELEGFTKTAEPRKAFRISNGRTVTRAFRDFYDSPIEIGDLVDLYRSKKRQMVEVFPGDLIIRKAGSHPIE
jgi:hypothetical protein